MRVQNFYYFNGADRGNKLVVKSSLIEYSDIKLLFDEYQPGVIINCIGKIKQSQITAPQEDFLIVNGLFPHLLEIVCCQYKSRLIQFSTDCVFSGSRGLYTELDKPDAHDIYGVSKKIGEIAGNEDVITIRTSIIGHELGSHHSLLEWFLTQSKQIEGYTNAVFSGFPAIIIAEILYKHILRNKELYGLYHISSDPISKYELLKLISKEYKKDLIIRPNNYLKIDRSLSSDKFKNKTGFMPKSWEQMINEMAIFR
jgi:dTDP-4-dehydrorhamnose reductase